ncbi:MAG: paiA [Chthoniobacteraceae bacterium]|nr:paiA [Chthoniobacteraceae bacterium]
MSSVLSVSPATEADIPLILAFIRELAEFENLTHEVSATEEKLRSTLFGARVFAESLIGSVDGEPAGFAAFLPSYSTFLAQPGLYLEDIYVRPQYRGRGLGRVLITAVAGIAVQRGCGRYEWSVLDWNAPAIRFYEGLGARMHSDWRRMRISGAALEMMAKG